jgi:RNA 2',3'-cyclic 3'-phosphodiesterase
VPRLFFAVWPPADVVERMRALPRAEIHGLRWIAAEQWHVTLRFLGNADATEAATRLESVALPPTTATVGPATSRLGRSLVIRVAGVDDLARVVSGVTADIGQPLDARGFTGHLTLARLAGHVPRGLTGQAFSAEFRVAEVTLVNSETNPQGARYTIIERWPTV